MNSRPGGSEWRELRLRDCVPIRHAGPFRSGRIRPLRLRGRRIYSSELTALDGINQRAGGRLGRDAEFVAQQIGEQFGVAECGAAVLVSRNKS